MRELLAGGTRQSLGRSGEAVTLVTERPEEFSALIACLWDEDPVVRMRAADAAEKATRDCPDLLQPYKRELLGLAREAVQPELRWHLALMLPRLKTTASERLRACDALRVYLEDRGSIVRTLAMQGLADLARQDAALLPEVVETIRELTRSGTAAMKARGRKLLRELTSAQP
jgi:hypothetical protein